MADTYSGEFYCVKCKEKRQAEGTVVETNGRRMAKDILDQRRKQMERAGERAQEVATEMRSSMTEGPKKLADDLEQRIESVLARMNIPTKETTARTLIRMVARRWLSNCPAYSTK